MTAQPRLRRAQDILGDGNGYWETADGRFIVFRLPSAGTDSEAEESKQEPQTTLEKIVQLFMAARRKQPAYTHQRGRRWGIAPRIMIDSPEEALLRSAGLHWLDGTSFPTRAQALAALAPAAYEQ